MTNTIKLYDMTDDMTRRRVFWLLQRLTSFSLWKRKRDAFARFANEYENAVKTWPEDDPEALPPHNLSIISEILAAYDRGLSELARGNRFVWQRGEPLQYAIDRYNHLNAYFSLIRITGSAARSFPRTHRRSMRWPNCSMHRNTRWRMRRWNRRV